MSAFAVDSPQTSDRSSGSHIDCGEQDNSSNTIRPHSLPGRMGRGANSPTLDRQRSSSLAVNLSVAINHYEECLYVMEIVEIRK